MYSLPTDKLRSRSTEHMTLVEYLEHEKQYRYALVQDHAHLKAIGASETLIERKRLELTSLGIKV